MKNQSKMLKLEQEYLKLSGLRDESLRLLQQAQLLMSLSASLRQSNLIPAIETHVQESGIKDRK